MASSDEEDLEALRNAALASLRQKQAAQEPQGIQVLGRISLTALQSPDQYNQQEGVPVQHPDVDYGFRKTGFEEMPYAFRQAVLQEQARGQCFARGFPRGRGWGRGWGRGRGNRFPPNPAPSSALIVIQPSGGQEEETKIFEASKDSRPLLLRPQDKWASTESGSQSSTPTRPKDTSKFSRYDDATDSEDDDEVVERRRRESGSANLMNMSLEDVSSDTEIEVHTHNNDDIEVHKHDNEIEVHNNEQEKNDSIEMNEKDSGLTDAESAIDMSQNITIDEVTSDLNTSQCVEKPDVEVVTQTKSNDRNEVITNVSAESVDLGSANGNISEIMLNANISLEELGKQELESDDTPLRDEQTPLRDELREEDSISNSYSAFSRFNRRNRRDSESAEESIEESDIEQKNVPSSRDSSGSRESDKSRSESDKDISDIESDVKDVELQSDEEIQERSKSQQSNSANMSQSLHERKSSVSSLKSSKSSRKSSSSSSSSGSGSDSSSSSPSSSSSSDSESSDEASSSLKEKVKVKRDDKFVKRKSKSPLETNLKLKTYSENKRSLTNDLRERKLRDKKEEKRKDSDRDKSGYYKQKENKRDTQISERISAREKSPYMHHKKSVKDRLSTNEIKADPEFDATNYRDEAMYHRNGKRGKQSKSTSEIDRKQLTSRENNKGDSRYDSKFKEKYGKDGKHRSQDYKEIKIEKNYKEKPHEKRYFESIGRLNMEKEHNSRKSDSKQEIEMSSKLKHSKISRANSVEIKNDTIKPSAKSNKKDNKNIKLSKSDSSMASGNALKSKSYAKESDVHKSTERRKSDEKLRKKSTEGKSKQHLSKEEQKSKRRSIEERLKRIASVTENLDSDSEKSVSSLSDVSSDSETENWRDKKHGASRKTADIELERRRRELKEREKRREINRKRENNKQERGGGDGDGSKRSKYRNSDTKGEKYGIEHHEGQNFRKDEYRDRRKQDEDERQKYYHKKGMVFYEEDTKVRKKFEEISSESDSGAKKGGVISVVRSDRKQRTEEIPSLLDINVSRPKSDKDRKVKKKSPKKERLIIHVEKSSDEEISTTKSRKKKVKKRKHWSSEEEESHLQQVVNVTFNEDTKPKKTTKSVYERLGVAVSKKSSSKVTTDPGVSGVKRSREVSVPSDGKRIKLNDSSRYAVTDKSKKNKPKDIGGTDDALNLRIQKIQEKNAEILRRKMEIEQDKQKYG